MSEICLETGLECIRCNPGACGSRKEIELLSCPFCDSEAMIHVIKPHSHAFATWMPDYKGRAFVECTRCDCGLAGDTIERAVNKWNTRKPMQEIVERLEAMSFIDYCEEYVDGGERLITTIEAINIVKEVGEINGRV